MLRLIVEVILHAIQCPLNWFLHPLMRIVGKRPDRRALLCFPRVTWFARSRAQLTRQTATGLLGYAGRLEVLRWHQIVPDACIPPNTQRQELKSLYHPSRRGKISTRDTRSQFQCRNIHQFVPGPVCLTSGRSRSTISPQSGVLN